MDMFLDSLFGAFSAGRKADEGFGDWVARNGLEAVKQQQQQQRAQLEALAPPSVDAPAEGSSSSNLAGAASS